MKRKIIAGILTFSLILSMFGCKPKESIVPNEIQQSSSNVSVSSQYPDMIMTKEEMLSDYDAMWTAIEENYPFFKVLERQYVLDGHEPSHYEIVVSDYRKQIEDMEIEGDDAMWKYIEIIAYSLYDACGYYNGHVSIINPDYWQSDLELYTKYADITQPWFEIISKPEVADFYEYYSYLGNLELEKEKTNASEEDIEQRKETLTEKEDANLTMKILEDGKVAYINVESFDDSFMEEDLPKIRTFLEEVKDYEHLIVNIQDNGGGNVTYWEDAFVKPNIAEPLEYYTTRLMNDGELTKKFYSSHYETSTITVDDVKNNPKFTALNKGDLENLTFAKELSDTTEPEFSEKLFKGKVWLLVGSDVFSAAESFADFCKSTGFATLVGETTGGGNSGDPILFELPISHLLIGFDVEYCLNANGSCSQEIGTTPDIESDDALQTVLELIG